MTTEQQGFRAMGVDSFRHPIGPAGEVQGLTAGRQRLIVADGAWTWFNDPRALFLDDGALLVGYVRGDGATSVARHDPASGASTETVLSTLASRERDDHNNPALTRLLDGRILVVYSRHGSTQQFHSRVSHTRLPAGPADWGPERDHARPCRTTYANLFQLAAPDGRLLDFHRCINWNPSLSVSTDAGESWDEPVHLIRAGQGRTRPYMRLCEGPGGRIDMIYTDHHPSSAPTSVYHLYLRGDAVFRSDGTLLKDFAGLPLDHDAGERGSVVYPYAESPSGQLRAIDAGIAGGRAWVWDVALDAGGHPCCVFSVCLRGADWAQDRIWYYWARWDGSKWRRRCIARAGRPLYEAERDYAGGVALDPADPFLVVLSSNAREPFAVVVDAHAETNDHALSEDASYSLYELRLKVEGTPSEVCCIASATGAIRPFVARGAGGRYALLWLEGRYSSYRDFSTRIVGAFVRIAGSDVLPSPSSF